MLWLRLANWVWFRAPKRTQAHFTENALRAAAGIVARDIGVIVQNGGKAGFGDGVAVFLRHADTGGFQVGLPFEGGGEIKGLRGGIVFRLQTGDSGEFEPYACAGCGCAVLYFRHNTVFACLGSFCVGQGNAVGAQRFGTCIQHAVTRHERFDTVDLEHRAAGGVHLQLHHPPIGLQQADFINQPPVLALQLHVHGPALKLALHLIEHHAQRQDAPLFHGS